MKEAVLVTGNPNKLAELQAIFPSEIKLTIEDIDLTEIQSMDPNEIVTDKLERAYAAIGKPVIVEDVSVELPALNGLPGPFIKYVEQSLGRGALHKLLLGHDDKRATIHCMLGYFDGNNKTIVDGAVSGTIVEPRGEHGFGFDFVFVLDGEIRTTAEMSVEEKNRKSHRYLAVKTLADKLQTQ